MHYIHSLLGAILIVLNVCHTAHAQQELVILRASSLNQGIQQTLTAPYQQAIKHAREATVAAGFDVESCERISDDIYIVLGKKMIAGDHYGEVIRVLVIRKAPTVSEVRLLVRQRISSNTLSGHNRPEKIRNDILVRLSSVNT